MHRRVGVSIAGAALAAAVSTSLIAPPPAVAAGVVITVTPKTNLHDKQVVKVSATGLDPSSSIDIAECQLAVTAANPANPGPGCDPFGNNVITDGSGKMPATSLTIHTGQLGSDPGSVCTAGTNGDCGIVVALHGFGMVFGTVVITFSSGTIPTGVSTALTSHASRTTVRAGKTFTIRGRITAAKTSVNGLSVALFRRANAKHAWARVSGSTKKTRTVRGLRGSYVYSLHGLSHAEQYQVRHPKQVTTEKIYRPSVSKVIAIKP